MTFITKSSTVLTVYMYLLLATLTVIESLTPLQEFEIDGNYYSDGLTDWITVLDGYRIDRTTVTNWAEEQNQCYKDGASINPDLYSEYWKSGVFCDTFGNTEQSLLAVSDDTRPYDWVPLNPSSAGSEKYDLTNAYFAGDDVDMIMCAAMERITTNGVSYVDFEFMQSYVTEDRVSQGGNCPDLQWATQDWVCRYPVRQDGDYQISFQLQNDNANFAFSILACQWNTTITPGTGGCGDGNWQLIFQADSADGSNILSGPIKAAVNQVEIAASPFGFIYDSGTQTPSNLIPAGAFLETCIDWRALGAQSMCFDGIVMKTKASPTFSGSLKDTGGVFQFPICGNINMTHAPSPAPTSDTAPPTLFPSVSPTNLPTNVPTADTSGPSKSPTRSPTSNPSNGPTTSPTTVSPTKSPTEFPTTSPIEPTSNPSISPSSSPTRAPTRSPTQSPTETGTTADPSKSPVTAAPTTANPSTSPTAPTAPTAPTTVSPTASPTTPNPSVSPTAPTAPTTQNPTGSTTAPTAPTTVSPTTANPASVPTKATDPSTQNPTSVPTTFEPTESLMFTTTMMMMTSTNTEIVEDTQTTQAEEEDEVCAFSRGKQSLALGFKSVENVCQFCACSNGAQNVCETVEEAVSDTVEFENLSGMLQNECPIELYEDLQNSDGRQCDLVDIALKSAASSCGCETFECTTVEVADTAKQYSLRLMFVTALFNIWTLL